MQCQTVLHQPASLGLHLEPAGLDEASADAASPPSFLTAEDVIKALTASKKQFLARGTVGAAIIHRILLHMQAIGWKRPNLRTEIQSVFFSAPDTQDAFISSLSNDASELTARAPPALVFEAIALHKSHGQKLIKRDEEAIRKQLRLHEAPDSNLLAAIVAVRESQSRIRAARSGLRSGQENVMLAEDVGPGSSNDAGDSDGPDLLDHSSDLPSDLAAERPADEPPRYPELDAHIDDVLRGVTHKNTVQWLEFDRLDRDYELTTGEASYRRDLEALEDSFHKNADIILPLLHEGKLPSHASRFVLGHLVSTSGEALAKELPLASALPDATTSASSRSRKRPRSGEIIELAAISQLLHRQLELATDTYHSDMAIWLPYVFGLAAADLSTDEGRVEARRMCSALNAITEGQATYAIGYAFRRQMVDQGQLDRALAACEKLLI